jgi:predicted permease
VTPRRDGSVDDELQFHLDSRADALVAGGMARDAARAQALREFGDLEDARRYMTRIDMRLGTTRRRRDYMGDFIQDLRYALRRLRSAPAFAITAMLTLALGIGANAAIFSLVYGVLVRPLPFPEPDRLYAVYSANRTADQLRGAVSPVDLDDWRASRQVIEDIGGYFWAEGSSGTDMTGRGAPRRLSAVTVSPGFFTALGVQPLQGRLPREDELVRGGQDTFALLTHGFWIREFAGATDVVGSTITLGGRPHVVIGVLPPTLRFPTGDADVFLSHSAIPDTAIPRIRPVRVLSVVARARPGATEEQVRAEMMAITARLAQQYPEDRAWDAATIVPLADVISGPVEQGLLVLFGAVGLVLLMACVNVTSLQLARAAGRGREIAVRLALGARRGRLVRQLLTESLLVGVLGGVAGIGLAAVGLEGLLALAAGQVPRSAEVGLDPVVMFFAAAVSLVSGVLVGLAPALRISRGGVQQTLRDGGRNVAGAGQRRLRRGLVIAEVAVAMMLVVGAGLMARSFLALTQVDAGFNPDRLLAVQFTIDPARHADPAPAPARPPGFGSPYARHYQQLIEKVRTLPGIVSAAAVKDPPFRGNGERNGFMLPGRSVPPGQDPPSATVIHVSEGYFKTIGARVDGREYTVHDRAGAPFVLVVNEAFARQHFPGERAVGKTVLFGRGVPVEIIGVVNDIRQVAIAEPARPTMYLHNLQNSRVKTTIVARTAGDPLAMAEAVRQAIWSLDPNQAITAVFTFEDAVSRALARPRLLTVLLGAFGVLGLALGAVGLYGVLASLVGEQRREIGVRLALGASPRDVQAMVIRGGLRLAGLGIVIGLAGAWGLTRFLDAVLYGVGPSDPATFAGMMVVFVMTALAASWLPARRASRLDPVETLRTE